MLKIRPVDLANEKQEILARLKKNLGIASHPRRFDWLYLNNPSGRAWSWFAYETGTERIVGSASVFPRVMWVGGEQRLCGQVGHFSIDEDYRSLGPALMLQRATLLPVDEGQLAFCYDTPPHELGMSTFRRLGMKPNCRMHRYARLLKLDRHVEKLLRRRVPVVAQVGNALLRLRDLRRKASGNIEISQHLGRFDGEFTSLDERIGGGHAIRSRRRAEDLNWRYRDDPLLDYTVLIARRSGELVAFLIYILEGRDARLIDLFGFPDAAIALNLVEALADSLSASPAETLHCLVSNNAWFASILEKAHFRRRDDSIQVVAYARPDSGLENLLDESSRWSFSHVEYMA